MIYKNMKAEMARNGITSANLAKQLGISRSSLSARMNGKAEFTIGEIESALSIFVGKTYEYLFKRN